jgi:hypothetical protein
LGADPSILFHVSQSSVCRSCVWRALVEAKIVYFFNQLITVGCALLKCKEYEWLEMPWNSALKAFTGFLMSIVTIATLVITIAHNKKSSIYMLKTYI